MVRKSPLKHNYWLMKSEPGDYSIDDLSKDKRQMWDGIRNYQVRNMMRDEMKRGDIALFYHSNTGEIGVVGEMEIVSEAYADPTQFQPKNKHYDPKSTKEKPRWLCVDVKFRQKFPQVVSLREMKGETGLRKMRGLQKGNRLSITPLTKAEYDRIVLMAHQK